MWRNLLRRDVFSGQNSLGFISFWSIDCEWVSVCVLNVYLNWTKLVGSEEPKTRELLIAIPLRRVNDDHLSPPPPWRSPSWGESACRGSLSPSPSSSSTHRLVSDRLFENYCSISDVIEPFFFFIPLYPHCDFLSFANTWWCGRLVCWSVGGGWGCYRWVPPPPHPSPTKTNIERKEKEKKNGPDWKSFVSLAPNGERW